MRIRAQLFYGQSSRTPLPMDTHMGCLFGVGRYLRFLFSLAAILASPAYAFAQRLQFLRRPDRPKQQFSANCCFALGKPTGTPSRTWNYAASDTPPPHPDGLQAVLGGHGSRCLRPERQLDSAFPCGAALRILALAPITQNRNRGCGHK